MFIVYDSGGVFDPYIGPFLTEDDAQVWINAKAVADNAYLDDFSIWELAAPNADSQVAHLLNRHQEALSG